MSSNDKPDVTGILIVLLLFMVICGIGLVGAIISAIIELLK